MLISDRVCASDTIYDTDQFIHTGNKSSHIKHRPLFHTEGLYTTV